MSEANEPPYYPPFDGEPVYNLQEAADLIGRTTGTFYSEKTKAQLQALGCRTGGKEGWKIHHSALVQMGWITEEGEPTMPMRKGKGRQLPELSPEDIDNDDPFAMLRLSKEELVKQLLSTRASLNTSEELRKVLEKDIARLQEQVDVLVSKLTP